MAYENGLATGMGAFLWPSFVVYHNLTKMVGFSSIALAFELLSPTRVCLLFARALRRPVRYVHSTKIDVEVPIPNGYQEQLHAIEVLFGECNASYFGPGLDSGTSREVDDANPRNADWSSGERGEGTVVEEARALWGGWRGVEEYAREVFPLEEAANGMTWMNGNS